ncbi:MAG: hypothetical protein JNG83_14085, partial [Opitutaceae bacterium]|nr:hypothetical protein [Opitutaceae bacterium]
MTTRLRVALVLAALSLPVLASADAADPGELDFASFDPSAQSRRVEIDL